MSVTVTNSKSSLRAGLSVGLVSCETVYPPRGGPSVHVYQLWHRLRRMGYDVHAWGRQAVPGSREYPRTAEGLTTLMAKVDLLYIRFPFQSDFTIPNVACLLRNRTMPIVCEFNAPLYELTMECIPWQLWSMRYKAKLYARNHLLVRTCVDHAICVSKQMGDYVRREFGLRNVSVLPNGGDPDLFNGQDRHEGRAAMGVGDDDFVVFWGGVTAYAWQGLSRIFAAAQQFDSDHVRFVIAGDPRHLPKPLPKNVIAVGQLSYFDVPRFVAGADVCLSVYRDYDWCPIGFYGSALKLFDYLASGRPVIASRMGQICEVVRDGENGYLTNGTPQDIADKIRRLWQDPQKRESMGRAARQTVVQSYNWQSVAERTDRVIRALLSRCGRRSVRRRS